jgi:lipopolysaccharide/colanic/teichoic acid biosynthesis glycosyltransferase
MGDALVRASHDDIRIDQIRRALDITVAGAGLLVTALPMAVVALAIRRRLGSPVIFRQTRPGQHDRPFQMLKFRTMTDQRGPDGELLPDSARLTPFGARLRSLSVDELPSLVNVLRGEMSLVGPRPLLPRYTRWFTQAESRRFDVRPGMTGWAQVNGRNTATWDDRLAMDTWYVEHRSLRLDVRILARTLVKVVKRSGFVANPESTMLNFDDERRGRLVR